MLRIKREQVKDFFIINLGVLLMSTGIYLFKFPNHFSTGGVSGLSVIMGGIIPNLKPGPSFLY